MISFFNLHTPHSISTKMMDFTSPMVAPPLPTILNYCHLFLIDWLVVVCVLVDWRPSNAI